MHRWVFIRLDKSSQRCSSGLSSWAYTFSGYINDVDLEVQNDILKFADDTKLYGIVTNIAQAESMQQDLNGLIRWTSQWQMKFNVDKCSVMHIGTRNIQYTYKMNGQVLQQVDAQSDLGVVIRKDLKASDQCAKAYAKASRVLGMIGRNIRYKSREVMLRLYKSMVRPHVEYCTVAWSPHYVKDKQLIEKIQRRFIKMIPGFEDLSYEEGLRILRLNTLEERRNRADLILLFKMYKELSRPPFESLFQLTNQDKTRGHTLKLTRHCTNRDVRLYFFSERVIDSWNQLDQSVVDAGCVDTFKRRLHAFRNDKMDLFTD